jgi:myo-inositol-1(or 4)-monophosphatase
MDKINHPTYQEEIEVAVEAAREAADILDEYQLAEERIDKTEKGHPNDIVTQADYEAQTRIVETLKEHFPQDGVRAEEGLESEGDRTWIIDPLDGTSNFQRGYQYFCTSIALKQDGELKLGVVCSPETAKNELFFSVKNSGAYKLEGIRKNPPDAVPIGVSNQDSLNGAMVLVQISPINKERREMEIEAMESLVDRQVKFRKPAAAALSLSKIAEGVFDGTIEYVFEWDYAAGALILEEAGGSLRTRESKWNGRKELIASNSKLQGDLENSIEDTAEDPVN